MQTIYKYPVPVQDEFVVDMPIGAEVLAVQIQGGEAQMWALVETDRPMSKRTFYVRGTGNDYSKQLKGAYVGTFQTGRFVWHLFEV